MAIGRKRDYEVRILAVRLTCMFVLDEYREVCVHSRIHTAVAVLNLVHVLVVVGTIPVF